jgi:hypothetical protein
MLTAESAVLVIADVKEKLARVMFHREPLVENLQSQE